MKKKTKIICTIGPSCWEKSQLQKLLEAGMDAARINTSHGNFKQYKNVIDSIRSIKNIPIILDTKGPEIRIHTVKEYHLKQGKKIKIGFSAAHPIYFDKNFYPHAKKGDIIFLDDGLLKLKIIHKHDNLFHLVSFSDGVIRDRVRVNIPTIDYQLQILTNHDKQVMLFGREQKVDFIALSYTRSVDDIAYVRKKLGSSIGIIAKIENPLGVKNFDAILANSDGIMVARGDLGIEVPPEKVPILQKVFIMKCNQKGKFVITATQMLHSMVSRPMPTRAEISDVANAIWDGTDMIMLSAESATGKYPLQAVRMMKRIAKEAEPFVVSNIDKEMDNIPDEVIDTIKDHNSKGQSLDAIVVFCAKTARLLSRNRFNIPIIAVIKDQARKHLLDMYYGVFPVICKYTKKEDSVSKAAGFLYKQAYLQKKDFVLFVTGASKRSGLEALQIHSMEELIER